jgi:hypothetical protein
MLCIHEFSFWPIEHGFGKKRGHLMEATPSGGEKSLRSTWPVQLLFCAAIYAFAFFHGRGKKELCT